MDENRVLLSCDFGVRTRRGKLIVRRFFESFLFPKTQRSRKQHSAGSDFPCPPDSVFRFFPAGALRRRWAAALMVLPVLARGRGGPPARAGCPPVRRLKSILNKGGLHTARKFIVYRMLLPTRSELLRSSLLVGRSRCHPQQVLLQQIVSSSAQKLFLGRWSGWNGYDPKNRGRPGKRRRMITQKWGRSLVDSRGVLVRRRGGRINGPTTRRINQRTDEVVDMKCLPPDQRGAQHDREDRSRAAYATSSAWATTSSVCATSSARATSSSACATSSARATTSSVGATTSAALTSSAATSSAPGYPPPRPPRGRAGTFGRYLRLVAVGVASLAREASTWEGVLGVDSVPAGLIQGYGSRGCVFATLTENDSCILLERTSTITRGRSSCCNQS